MKEQSSSKDNSSLNKNVFPELYSFDWANRKLRFVIATLQGKYEVGIWKRKLTTALIVKDELLEHGFKWQADRIDNWIHRLQPRKADSVRAVEVAH